MKKGDVFWCTQPYFTGPCIYIRSVSDDEFGDIIEIVAANGHVIRLNAAWVISVEERLARSRAGR